MVKGTCLCGGLLSRECQWRRAGQLGLVRPRPVAMMESTLQIRMNPRPNPAFNADPNWRAFGRAGRAG
jgi:hypothetical protein